MTSGGLCIDPTQNTPHVRLVSRISGKHLTSIGPHGCPHVKHVAQHRQPDDRVWMLQHQTLWICSLTKFYVFELHECSRTELINQYIPI